MEILGPGPVRVTLRVNDQTYGVAAEPRATLLEVLRDALHLTGAKDACGMGDCGACTVLLDGSPRYACLTLAVEAAGRQVETIEGLLGTHPVQGAFVRADAVQCGFCTPGQVMSVVALLRRNPAPAPNDVALAISGNLCRCGTYPKIIAAALDAAARMSETRDPGLGTNRRESAGGPPVSRIPGPAPEKPDDPDRERTP